MALHTLNPSFLDDLIFYYSSSHTSSRPHWLYSFPNTPCSSCTCSHTYLKRFPLKYLHSSLPLFSSNSILSETPTKHFIKIGLLYCPNPYQSLFCFSLYTLVFFPSQHLPLFESIFLLLSSTIKCKHCKYTGFIYSIHLYFQSQIHALSTIGTK